MLSSSFSGSTIKKLIILLSYLIIIDDLHLDDEDDIIEAFSKHFSSLNFDSEITECESSTFILNNFKENVKLKLNNSPIVDGAFSFLNTNADEIKILISQLDSSSSAGIAEIPVQVFKLAENTIPKFLEHFYNDCIKQQHIPQELKCALVSPLFKNKGETTDMNNYRGISVLPPAAKILEKILAQQIRSYFEDNNLFVDSQHGFRTNHSCETALHELISQCKNKLDRKQLTCLLFIDFKKSL